MPALLEEPQQAVHGWFPLDRALGPPATVLVVSDLHLGEGQDPTTRRYSRRENFFADAAFDELLKDHEPADGAALLVLNGDTFDFLRITALPESPQDVELWARMLSRLGAPRPTDDLRRFHWREWVYGLRTEDYKSVWKLLAIRRGHRTFFQALGSWVRRGGRVVFVKGNHDLELRWRLVRDAIRALIPAPRVVVKRRVLFFQHSFQLANLYFEHGHRFEDDTRVCGSDLLPGERELRLPLGSFVNRYVINQLEGLELFFANIKPAGQLLWRLLHHHPLKAPVIAWRAVPFLRRAARPYAFDGRLGFGLYFGTILVPLLTVAVMVAAAVLPGFRAWIEHSLRWLRYILGALGLVFPLLVGLLRDLVPKRKRVAGEDAFAEGLYKTLARLPRQPFLRRYGILGHTHRPDTQVLEPLGGSDVWYVNTGTWAPRWEEDRPDLMGRIVHSLVRFRAVGAEYRHECIEWTPPGGVGTPAILFGPERLRTWRQRTARRVAWYGATVLAWSRRRSPHRRP